MERRGLCSSSSSSWITLGFELGTGEERLRLFSTRSRTVCGSDWVVSVEVNVLRSARTLSCVA